MGPPSLSWGPDEHAASWPAMTSSSERGQERFGEIPTSGSGLRRSEGGQVLQNVPGLGLLEGVGVEPAAAECGQERRPYHRVGTVYRSAVMS